MGSTAPKCLVKLYNVTAKLIGSIFCLKKCAIKINLFCNLLSRKRFGAIIDQIVYGYRLNWFC